MKASMGDLVSLQNAILYMDGRTDPAGKIEKAKLAAATRMYLRNVLAILQPVMKAYADTVNEQTSELLRAQGLHPERAPMQLRQQWAELVSAELLMTEVDVRLPRRKLDPTVLNVEDNQQPTTVLNGLAPIVQFPKEELEDGTEDNFAATFRKAAKASSLLRQRGEQEPQRKGGNGHTG